MLDSKNRVFSPYFSIGTCPMRKTAFVDKSRIEPTIFLIEKISFSLKLFSGHFYGQIFIKTVRGPFYRIELPLWTLAKCKIRFTGHWLRYSITPKIPTPSTQCSQAINLALIVFAAIFTCYNSDHRQAFKHIYQSLPKIMDIFFNKNARTRNTRANMTTNWQ